MFEAIVMLLLNIGLRVDELVRLTWQRIQLHARSGWIDVVGKGDKHRRLPLNLEAREPLEAIQPVPVDDVGAVFRGKRGPVHGALDRVPGHRARPARTGAECASASVPPRHGPVPGRVGDLPTVAAWLDDQRLDTVRIYSQPDEAALERAAAALESH
jgi:integrase